MTEVNVAAPAATARHTLCENKRAARSHDPADSMTNPNGTAQ